jgi:hypothetical protein
MSSSQSCPHLPAGAHDDWVDALVQALNYLRASGGAANAGSSPDRPVLEP